MWDLEYLECAEGTVAAPLGMCPLISQPTNAESHPGLLSTKSWKVSMEVEGIQDLK